MERAESWPKSNSSSNPEFRFTNPGAHVTLYRMKWKKILPLLPALLLTGCAATFTNLTPLQQARNGNNLYPVEVAFTSQQQSLLWNSIHPYVLVNGQLYDMHPTPLVTNRWEGFVPVPTGDIGTTYRYKFDYLYNNMGTPPKPSSAYSPLYKLQIEPPTQ
jgi:hypothetical protein